jgi:hypothetical protein
MAARELRLTEQDMAGLAQHRPSPFEMFVRQLRRKVRPLAVSVLVPILSARKKG